MRRGVCSGIMGRKRKRGPKRRPKKTGGVKKGTTQVSDEAKGSVVQLKHAGYSGNKIARALKLPRSTAHRIISVYMLLPEPQREGKGRVDHELQLWQRMKG